MRDGSEALGCPAWHLVTAPQIVQAAACDAAALIYALRAGADERVADAMKAHMERLWPVMEDHPEMTIGEAERMLQAQTDAAIRELEG